MTTHREGVNPGFLTRFSFSLQRVDQSMAQKAADEIGRLPGIDRAWFDANKPRLKVAYDGSVQNVDQIMAILEKHGVVIKSNWWNRLRLSLQRQTDQNIRDNAKHEAHCCNKLPPGTGH